MRFLIGLLVIAGLVWLWAFLIKRGGGGGCCGDHK